METNDKLLLNKFVKLLYNRDTVKQKEFYCLSELTTLTGLSYKGLQNRMRTVKEKYKGFTKFLRKKKRYWEIHKSLISEFYPKYNFKGQYTFGWRSIAKIYSLKDSSDELHRTIMQNIKTVLPEEAICFYTFETTEFGIDQIILISNIEAKAIKKVINKVIDSIVGGRPNYQIHVERIVNKSSLNIYLRKAMFAGGVIL
jgi:hypothetical protein